MGIVGSIRDHCFSDGGNDVADAMTENGKMIASDFRYFQEEVWYRMKDDPPFDANKFIFLYSNYQSHQQHLLELWKIVDVKKLKFSANWNKNGSEAISERWKYAIRKGVPLVYCKNIICMLFGQNTVREEANQKQYQNTLKNELDKRHGKVQIHTFSDEGEQAFSYPFLNREGELALKRICFLVAIKQGKLEYNPYFMAVLSMLLIFMREYEVFEIALSMVEGSANMPLQRQNSLVWHCVLNNGQFEKFIVSFYKKIKKISPTINIINTHLNSEGIDKMKICREIFSNFFFGFLPFPVILKIFMIYLNEGVQTFYRAYYAILKMTGPSIRDATNTKQILRIIKTKLLVELHKPEEEKKFFRMFIDLRLSPITNLKAMQIESLRSLKEGDTYYLPEIIGESEILSYQDLEVIWGFLPDVIKHYNLRRAFSRTSEGGYKEMLSQLQSRDFSLVVIQTLADNIFGVFFAEKLKNYNEIKQIEQSKMFKSSPSGELMEEADSVKLERLYSNKTNQTSKQITYFGSSESFLFTLSLKKQKFPSTGANVFYTAYNDDYLVVGGPANKPALQLDSSLQVGLSFSCSTYNSEPLHFGPPGEFRIKKLECFIIE